MSPGRLKQIKLREDGMTKSAVDLISEIVVLNTTQLHIYKYDAIYAFPINKLTATG